MPAIRLNDILQKRGFRFPEPGARFSLSHEIIGGTARELLLIQALGDAGKARMLQETCRRISPALRKVPDRIKHMPLMVRPIDELEKSIQ